jgi:hypothetical protein
VRRRRELPLVLAGVLLVIGGALAFAETSLHLTSRHEVLVTTRPLAAGQVLSPADLSVATISGANGLGLVASSAESAVLGQPLAVPLVAGAPLTTGELGSTSPLAAGLDVVALLIRPGGFPPSLASGSRVEVVPVPASGSPTPPPSTWLIDATVLSIGDTTTGANAGGSVVTLELHATDAARVAELGAAGEASLVEIGAAP